jgi:CBS domain-containing protein
MTVTEFLQSQVPFLHGITVEQASALAHAAEQLTFRPGQTVLFRGVTVEGLHVVASGRVIVYAKTKANSKELFEVAQLGPGSVFGETSIIEMGTASATIKAAEETLIFVIPQTAFRELLASNEEFRSRAEALIAERKKKTDELGKLAVAA